MVLLRLSSQALSRSRFALSPLAETVASMILLTKAQMANPWLAEWHGRHHADFASAVTGDPFAAGLVRLLSSTRWLPAFVTVPPPGSMRTTLADELPAVAAVDDAMVLAELTRSVEHSWATHDLAWLTGKGWGARTAELLAWGWRTYIEPEWPQRRAMLERDITYRAGLLATHGWPRALKRMGRRIAWVSPDAIRFNTQDGPDRVVGDDGMLFVPVSRSSGSWLCVAPPDRHALVYPIRGYAAEQARPQDDALDRLMGANRAAILRCLEQPATSSELATNLELSLGTVGGHIAVLRDANLIAGTRIGRWVIYRRTETGDDLVGNA
jgi:DNA-binding transcriptional ArsR family regulator